MDKFVHLSTDCIHGIIISIQSCTCQLLASKKIVFQVTGATSQAEFEMTFPERISLSIIALQYYSKSRILHDNPPGTHYSSLISRHLTQ